MIQPHITIIGSGLSGMMAAYILLSKGCHVQLLSIHSSLQSDSVKMKSGLACSWDREEDTVEKHVRDTIIASDYLANQQVVEKMCQQSASLADLLVRFGVPFTTTKGGSLAFQESQGATCSRSLYVGIQTGASLVRFLDGQLKSFEASQQLKRYQGWDVLSFVCDERQVCHGLVAMHHKTLELKVFESDAVIVCSGGLGQIFTRSTQSSFATGSVASILYQAGNPFVNGEFHQFAPAVVHGLEIGIDLSSVALSEGGRYWVYRDGKPWYFAENSFSDRSVRVPSMVLSRLFHKMIYEKGLGIKGEPYLYVDLSQIKSESQKNIHQMLRKFLGPSVDVQAIPVSPGVSYALGGVWVDHRQATKIQGVYAAGECQFQGHGAHAVEDNLLLSSLYTGSCAAQSAYDDFFQGQAASGSSQSSLLENALQEQHHLNLELLSSRGEENPFHLAQELSERVSQALGVVRLDEQLRLADEKVQELMVRYKYIALDDHHKWLNQSLIFTRHLWNQLELSRALLLSALRRNESRGCHYKPEFPDRDDQNYMKSSLAHWSSQGPTIAYEKVDASLMKP